jgi:hypothetical protein
VEEKRWDVSLKLVRREGVPVEPETYFLAIKVRLLLVMMMMVVVVVVVVVVMMIIMIADDDHHHARDLSGLCLSGSASIGAGITGRDAEPCEPAAPPGMLYGGPLRMCRCGGVA